MFKRRSVREVISPFGIMFNLIFRDLKDGALPLENRSSWVIDREAFYRYLCPKFMAKLQLFFWLAILGDKDDQQLIKVLCNEERVEENQTKKAKRKVKVDTLFKKYEGYTDVLVNCWEGDLKFLSTFSDRVQDIFVRFMMIMATAAEV
jgi:hypothetical protein